MSTNTCYNYNLVQAENSWLKIAGITSLFIYALFWLMEIEISMIGESLIVLFFILTTVIDRQKVLLSEPVLYLLFAWIIFQVGVYSWSSDVFPALKSDHIREARIFTNVFMFVIIAWWLGANSKRVTIMITLCSIGYLIGSTFQEGGLLDELEKFSDHSRFTLGYINWEHASVYSAFVFITLFTLQGRITSYTAQKFKIVTKFFIFLALIYSVIAIIATQTRATWLALVITGLTFAIGYTLHKTNKILNAHSESRKSFNAKPLFGIAVAIISVVVLSMTFNAKNLVVDRLNSERDVINKLVEGDIENIPISSIGIRIITWDMAFDWIKQRPLTGWGPQSRKALLMESDLPLYVKKDIRHLHNSYIELLVAYGFIGLGLFAGLFFYVWYRAWQAWKRGIIPNDIMLFAALWSIYWLIVNGFESYVIYSATGNYINAVVAGILFTYHLHKSPNGERL